MTLQRTPAERLFELANYAVFAVLALIMIYPLWYIMMYSFSGEADFRSLYLVPVDFTLNTYRRVFAAGQVFTGFRNSVLVVLGGTGVSMVLTVLAAYPLSRPELYGKRLVAGLFVFTMLFNGGIIPTYLIVRSYGMVNTLWALFVPQAISIYNLMIMRTFFAGIPDSLIDSAFIDGYHDAQILVLIVLPLSKAVIAAVGLFYAVFFWNAFFPGMIYITDASKLPMQTVLYYLVTGAGADATLGGVIDYMPEGIKMASAFLTVLPILFVYPFLQKHFTKGVMLGALKG